MPLIKEGEDESKGVCDEGSGLRILQINVEAFIIKGESFHLQFKLVNPVFSWGLSHGCMGIFIRTMFFGRL